MSTQLFSSTQKPRTNLDPLFRLDHALLCLSGADRWPPSCSLIQAPRRPSSTLALAFTNASWDPVAQEFMQLVLIFGTLITATIALIIGVPVSFGIAMFSPNYAHCNCAARWRGH